MIVSFSRMNPNEMCEPNLGMEEEAWLGQGAQKQNQDLKMKPHAQAHLLSPTDKCKVCNEPAAKHVHYGAMTCFSCRAFFRRSIQNKTAATYVCRRSKSCEINLKTRKNCQFCRYMRCIAVGMKPTWVLSEEERQRRFRKNREKQEQQVQTNRKKEKKSHVRGNSFSEFNNDFSLDSIESSLSETLLNSPLLLDQQLPQLPERSRENIPVILEKQKVVIKHESHSPPAENLPVNIENIQLNQQFFTDHVLKAAPSYQQHQQFLVKTEASSFQPKTNVEAFDQQEQKVFQQPEQKVMLTPSTTHPTIVLYTSTSHFPQNTVNNVQSPIAQKSTIIVQPNTKPIKTTTSTYPLTIQNSDSLSISKPHAAQTNVQHRGVEKLRQNYHPTSQSSTPGVIVQPTPRFQQQQQHQQNGYQMEESLQSNLFSMNQQQKSLAANHMEEFVPESTFPLEIGSFATIRSEDQGASLQTTYSPTTAPQIISSTSVSTDLSLNRRQPFYKQSQYSPNTQICFARNQDDGWDSNYEDDVYTSDEEEGNQSIRNILSNEPEIKFSAEEYIQLEKLVKDHDERYRSVNFGEELIKEMIMCSMFGIPVSTSAAINGYRLSVERITRIAHNLDCFTDLPKNDQNNLLKENADLLVNLRGAIFFDKKKKGVDQVLISMGIEDLQTIKTMFTSLLKEDSMKHIDYKTFNSIQAVANPATESRYNFLQSRVADLITDDITTILITYIILFSVDFCSLMDRRRVEQTQEVYIRMLQRYIYSKMPRKVACSMLAKTLGAVTCLREMADIKKSRAINQNVKV